MQSTHEAFSALKDYLEQSQFEVRPIAGKMAFEADGKDEFWPIKYYFQIVDQKQFLFYIQPDITLIEEQLGPVAEFVARANFGMRIGNFELDYELNRPCFRSGLNFAGTDLIGPLMSGAIDPALEAYEEFAPALARVIAGLSTPKAAVREIEYGSEY